MSRYPCRDCMIVRGCSSPCDEVKNDETIRRFDITIGSEIRCGYCGSVCTMIGCNHCKSNEKYNKGT